jgi:hypothetical protein
MRLTLAVSMLLASSGVAAAPLSMKLAPELGAVEPISVLGRGASLWKGEIGFGGWQATLPAPFDSKSWTWEALMPESRSDEDLRVDAGTTAFQFELHAPEAAADDGAQCLAQGRFGVHTENRGRVTDETTVTLPGYPRIDCKFAGAGGGRMSLRPDFLTQRDSGLARFGDRLWNIQSVNNLASQRSSFPLARFGYEFRRGGEVVAAVEIAAKGRVWFSPNLTADEHRELASAVTALLYYGMLLEQMDS